MMKTQKEKIREEGRERCVCLILIYPPLLHVNSPFPKTTKSPKNILKNNIQI